MREIMKYIRNNWKLISSISATNLIIFIYLCLKTKGGKEEHISTLKKNINLSEEEKTKQCFINNDKGGVNHIAELDRKKCNEEGTPFYEEYDYKKEALITKEDNNQNKRTTNSNNRDQKNTIVNKKENKQKIKTEKEQYKHEIIEMASVLLNKINFIFAFIYEKLKKNELNNNCQNYKQYLKIENDDISFTTEMLKNISISEASSRGENIINIIKQILQKLKKPCQDKNKCSDCKENKHKINQLFYLKLKLETKLNKNHTEETKFFFEYSFIIQKNKLSLNHHKIEKNKKIVTSNYNHEFFPSFVFAHIYKKIKITINDMLENNEDKIVIYQAYKAMSCEYNIKKLFLIYNYDGSYFNLEYYTVSKEGFTQISVNIAKPVPISQDIFMKKISNYEELEVIMVLEKKNIAKPI